MNRFLPFISFIVLVAAANLQAEEIRPNRPNVIILLTEDQGTLDIVATLKQLHETWKADVEAK